MVDANCLLLLLYNIAIHYCDFLVMPCHRATGMFLLFPDVISAQRALEKGTKTSGDSENDAQVFHGSGVGKCPVILVFT